MSKNTEKLFRELLDHMDDLGDILESAEDRHQFLEQFFQNYSDGLPSDYDTCELDAYDYMGQAYAADSPEEAIKFAKKALKADKNFLDAQVLIAELSAETPDDLTKAYRRLLKKEETKLRQEGYFDDGIGRFWGLVETRPYMRLRYAYFSHLIQTGKLRLAASQGEDMLRLCENDNLGVRFTLMYLYALLEEESPAVRLFKRYDGNQSTPMLLAMIILYYKLDDSVSARKYLRRLRSVNTEADEFFLQIDSEEIQDLLMDAEEAAPYRLNSKEEIAVSLSENRALLLSCISALFWISEEIYKLSQKK